MIGQSIAHYRITAKLGEGGMGEVWRATDTKLNREVALKVLPDSFAQDPERMARFQREAHVLASLNHPNIAAIYGLEERALVMELVEGETLAGPLPAETALRYARQMIDALEAAHEKGIIHRDLKPANIKITPEGQVKVLDFGLAKAAEQPSTPGNPDLSPTMTAAATRLGVIMGTAGYMAPEQARGMAVDKRIDIWAFGVVLYEMLTGKRLFGGETISDTLAQVLTKEIDLRGLPAAGVLRGCLERDRKLRIRDIADARRELDGKDAPTPAAVAGRSRLGWAIAGVLGVALAAAGVALWMATRPIERPLLRVDADLGPTISLTSLPGAGAILSPDGSRVVFVSFTSNTGGHTQLMMRRMDQPRAVPIEGTEDAIDPFFSPDGQWIGFSAGGKLKKALTDGGGAVTLCEAPGLRGASWGEEGIIVASLDLNQPLHRIPASGGKPAPVTGFDKARGEIRQRWPQILPGGKTVLFTSSSKANIYDDANIDVVSVMDGRRKTVYQGGGWGRYLPSGHLIVLNKGTLFAMPFDLGRLEAGGTPSPVLEDVATYVGGRGQIDFSQTGTAVYQRGGAGMQTRTIQWMDNSGKLTPLLAKPGYYRTPQLSPDGKRLAYSAIDAGNEDIWVYDWQRDRMSRLTFDAASDDSPVWAPDGRHIAYRSDDGMYLIRSDGVGKRQQLSGSRVAQQVPNSFTRDGKKLGYHDATSGNTDLWALPLETDGTGLRPGKPEILYGGPFIETRPSFSPDGKWLAYTSAESNSLEVFVRALPDTGGKWQISVGGGDMAVWSPGGRELYYRTVDNRIMVVTYTVKEGSFLADQPRLWSPRHFTGLGSMVNFAMTPDGKRFAVVTSADDAGDEKPRPRVTFLFNFFDELRRKVPAGGGR